MLVAPYQTTVCAHYTTDKIEKALARAHIEAPLPCAETAQGERYPMVRMVTPDEAYTQVPSFTQPIRVNSAGQDIGWVFDARPFLRVDRRTGGLTYTSHNDFLFQVGRTALHTEAVQDGQAALSRLGDYPVEVFTRWLTSALAIRLNLDLEHQVEVAVIAAYYYFQLQSDTPEQDHRQRDRFAKRIARITRAGVNDVFEILDKLPVMRNGKDLMAGFQKGATSLRLTDMKFADLYTVVIMSWVGVNARENVGVALEHLPTFIAMVHSGLKERSYRKTVIATRAMSTNKRTAQEAFSLGVSAILDRASET